LRRRKWPPQAIAPLYCYCPISGETLADSLTPLTERISTPGSERSNEMVTTVSRVSWDKAGSMPG
jgi:hypothetical protein